MAFRLIRQRREQRRVAKLEEIFQVEIEKIEITIMTRSREGGAFLDELDHLEAFKKYLFLVENEVNYFGPTFNGNFPPKDYLCPPNTPLLSLNLKTFLESFISRPCQ